MRGNAFVALRLGAARYCGAHKRYKIDVSDSRTADSQRIGRVATQRVSSKLHSLAKSRVRSGRFVVRRHVGELAHGSPRALFRPVYPLGSSASATRLFARVGCSYHTRRPRVYTSVSEKWSSSRRHRR